MSIEACQWGSARISKAMRQGGHSYRHKGNVRVDFIAIGLVATKEAKANVELPSMGESVKQTLLIYRQAATSGS